MTNNNSDDNEILKKILYHKDLDFNTLFEIVRYNSFNLSHISAINHEHKDFVSNLYKESGTYNCYYNSSHFVDLLSQMIDLGFLDTIDCKELIREDFDPTILKIIEFLCTGECYDTYFSNKITESLSDDKNFYLGFLKFLKSNFDIKNFMNNRYSNLTVFQSKEMIQKQINFINNLGDRFMKEDLNNILKKDILEYCNTLSSYRVNVVNGHRSNGFERFTLKTVAENYEFFTSNIPDEELFVKENIHIYNLCKDNAIPMSDKLKRFDSISEIFYLDQAFSWGNLTHANLRFAENLSFTETKENNIFYWQGFIDRFKERVRNGRMWYYVDATKLVLAMAKKDYSYYQKFMSDLLKISNKHHIRAIQSYVESYLGKVDEKQARRYRSEAQNVSLHAVKGMLEGIENYDDGQFRKNISQFSDSKHPDVVSFLTKTLDKKYLSLFIANSLANKNLLRKKMQEE